MTVHYLICCIAAADGARELRRDIGLSRYPWTSLSWNSLIGDSFVLSISRGDGTGVQRVSRDSLGTESAGLESVRKNGTLLLLLMGSYRDKGLIEGTIKAYEWLKQHPVMLGRQHQWEVSRSHLELDS